MPYNFFYNFLLPFDIEIVQTKDDLTHDSIFLNNRYYKCEIDNFTMSVVKVYGNFCSISDFISKFTWKGKENFYH